VIAPPRLNPDRLRRVDRWLGVPICFALTIVARVSSLFHSRSSGPADPPKNVLLIELAEMGTTVLACPAVHRLRSSYPDCRIFFLLFKHIDESVKVLNMVPDAQVMTIDVSNAWTIVRDTFRLMADARRQRIDTAINFEVFARFSTILTYLSGARTRVGFHPFTQPGQYIGHLFTHNVNYNPHIHTWQSLVALVRTLETPTRSVPDGKRPAATPDECVVPKITSTPAARDHMLQLIATERPAAAGKRLIAINPNASKLIAIRKWPLDRYADLVARLLADSANACVITGLASERDDAQYIVDRVRSDRLVDLTGKTTLRELIDLFNVVDVLVTNDSGPAHFAAVTDAHVVVFFGPETPALYRPLTERCTVMYADFACSPCVSAYNQRRSVCTDNQCLTHIPVDVVYGTVTRVLQGASS
jgi:ADP-heptose:LPS heptosyltransferase